MVKRWQILDPAGRPVWDCEATQEEARNELAFFNGIAKPGFGWFSLHGGPYYQRPA